MSWSESLVAAGLLAPQDLAAAERVAGERNLRLEDSVVALGAVSEDQVCAAVAEELGLAFVFPYPGGIEPRLLARFPLEGLRRLEALPLHEDEDGRVVVALARAPSAEALSELARVARAGVVPVLAAPRRIHAALEEVALRSRAQPSRAEAEAGRIRGDPAALALLFGALARAVRAGATELRFEPQGEAIVVRRRERPGDPLENVGREPIARLTALVARARILAGLATAAGEAAATPRAARLRTEVAGRAVEVAVAVLPASAGESVRIGLRYPPKAPASLAEAKLSADARAKLAAALAARKGLVLLAGDDLEVAAIAYAAARTAGPEKLAVVTLEPARLEVEPRFRQVEPLPGEPLESRLGACLGWAPDVMFVGDEVEAEAMRALERLARRAVVMVRIEYEYEYEYEYEKNAILVRVGEGK